MEEDGGLLNGEVEIDETFVGGKLANRHRQNGEKHYDGLKKKTAVVGAVQRSGWVKAQVVPNVRKTALIPLVVQHVMPPATVFTDEAKGYSNLLKHGYQHHRVNDTAKVYVEGNVHTNTIEGFWSLLRNGIRGGHHAVGASYLQSYVNEYTFRYNHEDQPMMAAIWGRVNKRRHGRYGEYAPVGE